MTEHTKPIIDDQDDLELITSWLNGHLDPEKVEAVAKRLEEDASFRELAAPLLLTWSIPRRIERDPRPEGEWEREWAKFTQRPDFAAAHGAHAAAAPRKEKRRWSLTMKVLLVIVGIYALQVLNAIVWDSPIPYTDVAYTSGWISLSDDIDVELTPETKLSLGRRRSEDRLKLVRLDAGRARFRVKAREGELRAGLPREQSLQVETRAGIVRAGESDLTVIVNADTTLALVHAAARPEVTRERAMVVTETTYGHTTSSAMLLPSHGARLVRDWEPTLLKSTTVGVRIP